MTAMPIPANPVLGSGSPIPLVGSGGLFTRIGVLGGLASAVNVDRGTTIPAHVAEVQQQYVNTNQDVINNLYSYLLSYQNAGSGIMSNIKTMAANTVVEMANQSVLQPNTTTQTALQLLINQMKAAGQSVNACSVSAALVPCPTNVGNAVGIASFQDVNGVTIQYAFNELATGVVTNDYQSSVSLLGVEPITIRSPQAVSDTFSWLYPQGSGITLALSAVSALKNGGSGTSNWLNNGAMESFTATANVPDFWHVQTGTPGTTIFQSTAFYYDGSSSVQFLGNGSEQTAIYQAFSIAGKNYDTNAIIYPNSQLAINFALRVSSPTVLGQLRVQLASPSGVTRDNQDIPNEMLISIANLNTSWQVFQAVFRTPNQLPSPPIYLLFMMNGPLDVGISLYIDHVSFTQMTPLYAGGPSVSIFSGNIPLVRGDTFAINSYNSYDGVMQYLFDKLFGMKSLGLILPSLPGGTATIPDNLVR